MAGVLSNDQLSAVANALVSGGIITKDQLAVAQVTQQTLGGNIAQILVKKGFVEEAVIRDFMSEQLSLEGVSLADVQIDPGVVKTIPQSVAEEHGFMPLVKDGDVLIIAISDPLSLFGICAASAINCPIEPVLVSEEDVQAAIQLHYANGGVPETTQVADDEIQIVKQRAADDADQTIVSEESGQREKIVSVVNAIIMQCVQLEASDIHVEPQTESTRIRARVDGMLKEIATYPRSIHSALTSRLKVIAGMDIAERRMPQDGRVRLNVKGQIVDIRISSLPTMYGEKIVMRLLIKTGTLSLEQLGLLEKDKNRFADLIERPYGIFLVTGPTGSGKTSTLYAALQRLNSQERNIVSVEDPVENEVQGINQSQVNVKAGMTFASALRSILRQDPDVIMLGEIRDGETADMAVRAALTGHLVFSTLHTNSALGAIERLVDMDVERFLIGSALLGVMAQRLVRRICQSCREETTPDPGVLAGLKIESWAHAAYRGRGCEKCRMTGFRGRVGIFELVTASPQLREAITQGMAEEELRQLVRAQGVFDMRSDGLEKVQQGLTTLEEVLRVTQEG